MAGEKGAGANLRLNSARGSVDIMNTFIPSLIGGHANLRGYARATGGHCPSQWEGHGGDGDQNNHANAFFLWAWCGGMCASTVMITMAMAIQCHILDVGIILADGHTVSNAPDLF